MAGASCVDDPIAEPRNAEVRTRNAERWCEFPAASHPPTQFRVPPSAFRVPRRMTFPDRLPIPPEVLKIAQKLEDSGYETWCVGGAIRDNLLELENPDFDLTTAAPPAEVRKLFKRTVPAGLEHGPVAVLDRRDRPTRLEAAAAVGGRGGGADLAAGDSGEGRRDSGEGRARQAATRPGLNHGLPRDRPGVPPDQAQVLEQGDRAGPGHRRVAGQVSRPETSAGGASLALPGGRIRRRLAHPATGTFFSHLPAPQGCCIHPRREGSVDTAGPRGGRERLDRCGSAAGTRRGRGARASARRGARGPEPQYEAVPARPCLAPWCTRWLPRSATCWARSR